MSHMSAWHRAAQTCVRSFMLAGCVAFFAAGEVAAQTADPVRLSLPQARELGLTLNNEGRPAEARALARELLSQNPDDVTSLLILSRAERMLGNPAAAEQAGKSAWRLARTPLERYSAALLTARALTDREALLRAQFWLRRAAQIAPNEELRTQTIAEFRAVKRATPLDIRLAFSITPSSNVNNGSQSPETTGGGTISASGQALSGLEYFASARLSYDLPRQGRLDQQISGQLQIARYSFSSSSKRKLQADFDERGISVLDPAELAYDDLTLRYDLTLNDTDDKGANSLGLNVSRSLYGGSTLNTAAGVTLGRRVLLNPSTLASFSVGGTRNRRADIDSRSSTVWTAQTRLVRVLENGDQANFGIFLRDTNSNSAEIANVTKGISAGYAFGKPILGRFGLDLGLSLQSRRGDRPQGFDFITRDDLSLQGSATITFNDADYYGFVPTATVRVRRTRSTEARYDTRDLGLNIGLQSSF